MHSRTGLVSVVVVVVGLVAMFSGRAQAEQLCACATSNVNVRSGPGTSYPVLNPLQSGQCVPYDGNSHVGSSYTWKQLAFEGQCGWAAENWLNIGACSSNTGEPQCACATSNVNARNGAGTSHSQLGTLQTGECWPHDGTTHTADGYTWLHINYDGQCAWTASNWLNVQACETNTGGGGCSLVTIVSRAEWGARAPVDWVNMTAPPTYVFIHHGASQPCSNQTECMARVRAYQNYHMDSNGWSDIGYSFVVGEDGNVYEGRGWDRVGAHTSGYNDVGIAICFIGNFMSSPPNQASLMAAQNLIQCGLDTNKINPDYTLKGHRDVGSTTCPGDSLYEIIQGWPHFVSSTQTYTP